LTVITGGHPPVNWGDCYYDHFERYFGKPTDRQVFERDKESPSIQILAYEGVFKSCVVFCSLGLSHYSNEIGRISEVYLVVDDAFHVIPNLLANTLFYMVNEQKKIGWGLSIRGMENLQPEFSARYQKSALYFTNPFGLPAEFGQVQCSGNIGAVYTCFPISAEEHDLFLKVGAHGFEDILEQRSIDPFTIARPSSVP
jgi:antitoxin YqcF